MTNTTAQAHLAKEMRKWLIDANLSQRDAARRMGMHPTTLSALLNGRRRWPADFPGRFGAAVSQDDTTNAAAETAASVASK